MTMESLHLQILEDETPENERTRMDPDHWYEINLTNSSLFANLSPEKIEGMEQLVPGRLFTTRMPRDLDKDETRVEGFLDRCQRRSLKVVFVLTEPEEFEKYSGTNDLLEFYRDKCGLTVYNRAIPDFQIPTEGDLVDNILDLTYHLSYGENCLVHCAGGTGRTGMVVAAIVKNFGVYDPVARIRKLKSTYVETVDQELFLKNMPKAINSRLVKEKPTLARAIAAEHLIQVFRSHKGKFETAKGVKNKESVSSLEDSTMEDLDEAHEEGLKGAYGKFLTFLIMTNLDIWIGRSL